MLACHCPIIEQFPTRGHGSDDVTVPTTVLDPLTAFRQGTPVAKLLMTPEPEPVAVAPNEPVTFTLNDPNKEAPAITYAGLGAAQHGAGPHTQLPSGSGPQQADGFGVPSGQRQSHPPPQMQSGFSDPMTMPFRPQTVSPTPMMKGPEPNQSPRGENPLMPL